MDWTRNILMLEEELCFPFVSPFFARLEIFSMRSQIWNMYTVEWSGRHSEEFVIFFWGNEMEIRLRVRKRESINYRKSQTKRKLKLSRRSKNFWPNFQFSSTQTSGFCHEARDSASYLHTQVVFESQAVHEPSATTTVGLSGFHSLKIESDNWSWIRLLFFLTKATIFLSKLKCVRNLAAWTRHYKSITVCRISNLRCMTYPLMKFIPFEFILSFCVIIIQCEKSSVVRVSISMIADCRKWS